MTSRERIFTALRGEKADRAPWIPLCYRDFFLSVPEYRKRFPLKWHEEYIFRDWRIGKSALDDFWNEELEFRINFYRNIGADFLNWGPFDCVKTEVTGIKIVREQKGDELLIRYETPAGVLTESFVFSSPSQTLFRKDFLIKEDRDYEVFRYVLENTVLESDFLKAKIFLEMIGEKGVSYTDGVAPPLHSWINDLLGIEKLALALFDNNRELKELLEIQEKIKIEKCRILTRLPNEIFVHQATWDIGIISPEIYKKYYLPHIKKYNRILHKKGKICLDHLSGQRVKPYLKLIEETDFNGLYGLVYPSMAEDISFGELSKRWKQKKMVPTGGLNPDFLATSSPYEIAEMTKKILEEAGENSFLLGTADAVVYGTPIINLETVSNTVQQYTG